MHIHIATRAIKQGSGSLFRTTPGLLLLLLSISQFLPLSTVAPAAATDGEENTRPVCSGSLRWAPLHIKQPYTSLLNSAYCPSWTTRHILTKLSQNTHLTLPQGVPFALLCGLCYNPNTLESNVTLRHQADGADQPLAQVPIRDPAGALEHSQRKLECLLQYALTGPVSGYSGRFTCQGSIGSRAITEQATYSVYDVPITITKETLDVPGRSVMLTCPSHPDAATPTNPLVHVWYYPLATSPRLAAPTTNPTVTFRLGSSEPLVVSCATYHILSVTQVVVTTFTVRRSESYKLQGEAILGSRDAGGAPPSSGAWDNSKKYGIYGDVPVGEDDEGAREEASTAGEGYQLPLVMVAVLSAAAAIIAVIVVIASVKCLRRGGNGNRRR